MDRTRGGGGREVYLAWMRAVVFIVEMRHDDVHEKGSSIHEVPSRGCESCPVHTGLCSEMKGIQDVHVRVHIGLSEVLDKWSRVYCLA